MKTTKGTEIPLLNLRGKDYLEVKYRILWFREEKPDWGIETSMHHGDKFTIATAIIKNEQGRIIAMSHKREDEKGFPDYMEKAETGAIGRALALIGYGTQFATEIEEGERIVDSPIERKPASKKEDIDKISTPFDDVPPPEGTLAKTIEKTKNSLDMAKELPEDPRASDPFGKYTFQFMKDFLGQEMFRLPPTQLRRQYDYWSKQEIKSNKLKNDVEAIGVFLGLNRP